MNDNTMQDKINDMGISSYRMLEAINIEAATCTTVDRKQYFKMMNKVYKALSNAIMEMSEI